MVVHQDSLWNWVMQQLGNGLLLHKLACTYEYALDLVGQISRSATDQRLSLASSSEVLRLTPRRYFHCLNWRWNHVSKVSSQSSSKRRKHSCFDTAISKAFARLPRLQIFFRILRSFRPWNLLNLCSKIRLGKHPFSFIKLSFIRAWRTTYFSVF